MMKKKSAVAKIRRTNSSAGIKAKLALAVHREDETLAQLSAEFQVHTAPRSAHGGDDLLSEQL